MTKETTATNPHADLHENMKEYLNQWLDRITDVMALSLPTSDVYLFPQDEQLVGTAGPIYRHDYELRSKASIKLLDCILGDRWDLVDMLVKNGTYIDAGTYYSAWLAWFEKTKTVHFQAAIEPENASELCRKIRSRLYPSGNAEIIGYGLINFLLSTTPAISANPLKHHKDAAEKAAN